MTRRFAVLIGALLGTSISVVGGPVLWYQGDWDFSNGFANERNTVVSAAAGYDSFIVPAPGWIITAVFSNNVSDLRSIVGADWEIRSGISPGNGGTVIASGMNVPASWTLTGRSGFNYQEYQVYVGGLNVYLSPGQYWLMVRPVGSGGGRSFVTTTSGLNGVNALLDGVAYFDSSFFGRDFEPNSFDFSMGVEGVVAVPEPATLGLAASGLLLILARR
ncbi:MAG: PEP-CTERM sorting domain-containing protein, partial [Bryobacterales bacterium]|nr:PEP-CTERM sorting domain-containing protein [Bryobacterales bacterium]